MPSEGAIHHITLTGWFELTCYSSVMTEVRHAHFKRHRFPAEIIAHAVWLYYRFPLSLRDVEDLLAERGIIVTFQTVAAHEATLPTSGSSMRWW